MGDILSAFLFAAVVGAVIMASITRSLGGAFLGVAIVSIGAAFVGFTSNGFSGFVGGVLALGIAFVCLILTMATGINFSHSVLNGHDPNGNPFSISQSVLGEGAKATRWNAPNFQYHQVGSGERYKEIGDGS